MNVLSLFDGLSGGMIALERASIKVDNYFASEIDKYAIKISQHNYPNIVQLGDVTEWREWELPEIDLILAGSPCQGFSFAGKQLNFDDPRSKLFFEFADILEHYKPKYFMLENVKMKKESEQVITERLGVEPIEINSALVSAQNRKRLYWTNIPNIKQPEDKVIFINDFISDGHLAAIRGRYLDDKKTAQFIEYRKDKKTNTLTTVKKDNVVAEKYIEGKVLASNVKYRYLSAEEYEILQNLPIGYTSCVPETQRYKAIGNGWTIDVIAHILGGLK